MKFHIVTLFPEVIDAYASVSILARANKAKLLEVKSYQLRDFAVKLVKTKASKESDWFFKRVDDKPYGGGPGMMLQAEPFINAVDNISRRAVKSGKKTKILITAAGGKPLTNAYAKNLTKKYSDVIILCGRYEGIDARVKKILKAEEVSVGPYILTAGELPALSIIDTTARQIPGVLGKFESLEESRVASHEIYTRPEVFIHKGPNGVKKSYRVPKVLLSGNHKDMDVWKNKKRSDPGKK